MGKLCPAPNGLKPGRESYSLLFPSVGAHSHAVVRRSKHETAVQLSRPVSADNREEAMSNARRKIMRGYVFEPDTMINTQNDDGSPIQGWSLIFSRNVAPEMGC